MADISEELITYLKTVTGVTNLVGTTTAARIYNQDGPPQGSLNPTADGVSRGAVCLVKTGDENIGHLGGRSALNVADYSITVYAITPTLRNSLASAVWDALAPEITQTMGGTAISEIVCVNKGQDADAFASEGSDARIYMSQSAYRIWYYSA